MRRMGRIWTWREEDAGAFWDEARTVLKRHGIIAVPTETFFGLAVNPFQEEALVRLFALKDRAPEKPVLLLVDGPEMLNQVAREVPGPARRLMEKFWPGPLTIIFPSLPHLPRRLTGGTGTIGVRQPRQSLTCRLITALGHPITGTSANRAGHRPLRPGGRSRPGVRRGRGPDPGGGSLSGGIAVHHCGRNRLLAAAGPGRGDSAGGAGGDYA